MRQRSIVLIALILSICASLALAQGVPVAQQAAPGSGARDEQRVISLNLVDTDIIQALDILLKGTGRDYRIDEGVRVAGRVSIHLQDVPLDNAVHIVLRSAGLQADRDKQTYLIKRAPMVPVMQVPQPQQDLVPMTKPPIGTVDVKPSAGQGGQKFDILLDKANVLEAMKQIMEVARQNYVIDTGLDAAWAGPLGPRISSRMRGIHLDEAIQALGKSANLVVAKVGSTYTVRPPDGAMPFSYTGGKGGKVPAVKTESATPKSASPCSKCGNMLIPTWLFCPQCGAQIAKPAFVPGVAK